MFVKVCNQNIELMFSVLRQYYDAFVDTYKVEGNFKYKAIHFRGYSLVYSETYDKLCIGDISDSLYDLFTTNSFVDEIYMMPLQGIDNKNRLDMIFVLEPDSDGIRRCFYYDSITEDFMEYKSSIYISALSMFVAFDGTERLLYFYLNNEDNGKSVIERLMGRDVLNIGSMDNSIKIKDLIGVLSSLSSMCIRSFPEMDILNEWLIDINSEMSAECSDKCSADCAEKYAYSGLDKE